MTICLTLLDYLCSSGTSPRRTKKEMLSVSVNR